MISQQQVEFVVLVASDGTEFVLPVAAAKRSGFVSRILYASQVSAQNQPLIGNSIHQEAAAAAAADSSSSIVPSSSPPQQEQQQRLQRTVAPCHAIRLDLPDIGPSVLDVICQFICEAHDQASQRPDEEPLDMSRALAFFDPALAEDRMFVMELMVAADYLSC